MALVTPTCVPIIMCGGMGARLWPLSRDLLPKPFVTLPDGGTMMGELLTSLPELGCTKVVMVTSIAHVGACQAALAASGTELEVTVVAEPAGRGTAPALATALRILANEVGADTVFALLPADHHIDDRPKFNAALQIAVSQAQADKIAVLGIKPTRPSVQFGYIKAALSSDQPWAPVKRFIEKPPLDQARKMLASGDYYWNAGVFVATVRTMTAQLALHAPTVHATAHQLDLLQETAGVWTVAATDYANYPNISIDHAVAEHTDCAVVVPVTDAGWSDLGSWDDFMGLMSADDQGNRISGPAALAAAQGVGVLAAAGRTVAIAGCKDIVVVDTPDAVLVAGKDSNEAVRAVHGQLAERKERCVASPSWEERPWGRYRQLGAEAGWQVKRIEVDPGKRLSLQSHRQRAEHWTVVTGVMQVTVDERTFELSPAASCFIPVGAKHRMANMGTKPAVLIEVQCGDYLGEDDIIRYEDDFGRS